VKKARAMEDGSSGMTRRLTEAYGLLKNVKRTMAMEDSSSGLIGRLTQAYGVLRTLKNKEAMEENSLDIFGRLLDVVPSGKVIVDSACGHGRYAVMARDTGRFSRVVAFDARSDRIPFHEAGIEWRLSRIEDWDYSGFDVVLLSGILYHLDPVRQTRVMRAVSMAKPLFVIVNTHHVLCEGVVVSRQPFRNKLGDRISHIEIDDGSGGKVTMSGTDFLEGGNLKNRPLAAFENRSSFWHTAESLTGMMGHYGFSLKQTSEPVVFQNMEYSNRNFFLFTKD
jgi:hypothetical protein